MTTKPNHTYEIGENLTVEITAMSHGTDSIGRPQNAPQGIVIFVPGGCPGDVAEVKVTKVEKNRLVAELVKIVQVSPQRVEPKCKVFGACGGCQWQHLSYETQLEQKKNTVSQQVGRAMGLTPSSLSAKVEVFGAENPWAYRSRIQIHGTKEAVGFFLSNPRDCPNGVVPDCAPPNSGKMECLGHAAW